MKNFTEDQQDTLEALIQYVIKSLRENKPSKDIEETIIHFSNEHGLDYRPQTLLTDVFKGFGEALEQLHNL